MLTIHNHSYSVQQMFSGVFEGKFHNLIPYDIYADYLQNSNIVKCKPDGEGLALCAPDAGAREFVREMFNRMESAQSKVHLAGQRTQRRAQSGYQAAQ